MKSYLKCYQPIHRYPLSHNIGPDSKVHGADMRPIRGLQALGGPHVGPMNFAICGVFTNCYLSTIVSIQYRCKRVEWDTMSYLNVLRWRHQIETFPRYWPFVREIHRSLVNSPHKSKWRGALMFSMISAWTKGWGNNRHVGDWKRHRAQYDVTVMLWNRAWKWKYSAGSNRTGGMVDGLSGNRNHR